MSSVIKIKPLSSTFVESSHANDNFSSLKKLYTGSIHTSPSNSIIFKTLLTFDSSLFYDLPIECAFLCFYVKDINSESSYYSNNIFSIYKNDEDFDVAKVTWNTTPNTSCCSNFTLDNTDIKKYIKIDISQYVTYWIESKKNHGITIEPQNYYSSLIKFASVNSKNPPWLILKYKSPSYTSFENHMCH